jgi:hypothetical protein
MTAQPSVGLIECGAVARRLPWHIAARVIAGCSLLLWWLFVLLVLSVARCML